MPPKKTTSGKKQVSPKALKRSVVDTPKQTGESPVPSLDASLLWMVGQAADEITPWGVRPKVRDRQLREFYPTESLFSSALGVVTSRNAGFKWTVEGPPRVAARVHQILEDADGGRGWVSFVSKLSVDLYTQDYGAFIEIVRDGNSPSGALLGINPLDAARCWHTGDPEKPVIYQDRKGAHHLLDWWNVVPLAELPTPVERLYGLQVCALSRLLLAAQITKNIAIYKKEKTGGRHAQAIHLIAGLSNTQIQDALAQIRGEADAQGLMRFLGPLIVGSVDPKANIDVKSLELTSLPAGFNEETVFKHYVSQIAMAFLADYQDFAPLPGGNLGTSAQSEMLHQKARGKGSAVFRKLITQALNFRILPSVVEFQFEEQDPDADEQQARIRLLRAQERRTRLEAFELTEGEARQLAMDDGDLPEELFESAGGVDATIKRKLPSGEKPEVPEVPEHIEEEGEQPEEGEKGEPEVSSSNVPFSYVEVLLGSKERAGPFEAERIRAERKLRLAVEKAFDKIFANVKKRLKREGRKEIAFKGRSDLPNDEAFWGVQKEVFMAALSDQPQELLQQGVQQASDLGLAVGFDVVNQQVLDLSATYTDQWWEQLSGTTRKGMRRAVQTHITEGTPLSTLTKDLEPLFGKKRAKLIAATEVTRLYTEGNRIAFEDSSVDQVQWQTVKDAVVDPDCEALQGQQWPLNQNPVAPPLHPGCRCWLAPVVDDTALTDRVDEAAVPPELQELAKMTPRDIMALSPAQRAKLSDRAFAALTTTGVGRQFEGAYNRYSANAKLQRDIMVATQKLAAGQAVGGEVGRLAKALTSLVAQAAQTRATLYRGITMDASLANVLAQFPIGANFDVPFSSASFQHDMAKQFAGSVLRDDLTSVVFEIARGAQGIPVSALSTFPHENEVLIGGRFSVTGVVKRENDVLIQITQTGRL